MKCMGDGTWSIYHGTYSIEHISLEHKSIEHISLKHKNIKTIEQMYKYPKSSVKSHLSSKLEIQNYNSMTDCR